jgi:hypothetical protein
VRASFSADEPVSVTITAVGDRSRLLTLLNGSKVAGIATGKPRTQLVYGLRAAGNVPLALRIPYRLLKRGHTYNIVVVAKAADGQSSRLVISFRS